MSGAPTDSFAASARVDNGGDGKWREVIVLQDRSRHSEPGTGNPLLDDSLNH
jgi:hypothetical protein